MIFRYILLLILSCFFLYVALLLRQTLLKKIFILFFITVMFIFSFNPDWSTNIAHFFGIGRGADLLFYISNLTLFIIAFIYYLKFKSMEQKFVKLARSISILQADNLGSLRKVEDIQKKTDD